MTTDQATSLMAYLIACYPTASAPQATMDVYLSHLEPLPYARAEAAVRRLVATHRYPSLPTIAELLEAAGVDDDESRDQFFEAMRRGLPLVRDARSITGWGVGTARLTPEALVAMNAADERAALPAGPLVDAEKKASLLGRLRGYARGLGAGEAVQW